MSYSLVPLVFGSRPCPALKNLALVPLYFRRAVFLEQRICSVPSRFDVFLSKRPGIRVARGFKLQSFLQQFIEWWTRGAHSQGSFCSVEPQPSGRGRSTSKPACCCCPCCSNILNPKNIVCWQGVRCVCYMFQDSLASSENIKVYLQPPVYLFLRSNIIPPYPKKKWHVVLVKLMEKKKQTKFQSYGKKHVLCSQQKNTSKKNYVFFSRQTHQSFRKHQVTHLPRPHRAQACGASAKIVVIFCPVKIVNFSMVNLSIFVIIF